MKTPALPPQRNWVAKYGRQFNRAQAFRDRTQYQRKPKHPQRARDEQ